MQADLENKHVLLTGAAGFIGSHLADALLAAGARVHGVDNFLTGRAENIAHVSDNPNFTSIEADVIEEPSSYLPADIKFDLVFHFASPASPPLYQAHPIETYQVNTLATHRLLQYILKTNRTAQFVFASTSEIYGDPLEHPQTESYWGNVNPNGIRSCYDEAKRLGETICGVHHRDLGMDIRIVRIFNTYGPRMNPQDGRVIPQFVTEALANQPLTIHGQGTQTRSYCYVTDLVRGIILLGTLPNLAGSTVNLGNPHEQTILETASYIDSVINPEHTEVPLTFLPLPQDDPLKRQPNITLAKKLLGWSPEVDFQTGIQKTIEAFKK